MDELTADQVLALAPDVPSAEAAQNFSTPARWAALGRSGTLVWGECQGSFASACQVRVDLGGPAFNCSCPSRKSPCKHGLGLLLLLAGNSARVPTMTAPVWVTVQSPRRSARAKPAHPAPSAVTGRAAGLEELEEWLSALIRQGLGHARAQPPQIFETMATRLASSGSPGLAKRLREWPAIFAGDEDQWASRALEAAGSLQFLLNGADRLDELTAGQRASVYSALGWPADEKALLAGPGAETVADHWRIMGQRAEEAGGSWTQRNWLVGRKTARLALHARPVPTDGRFDMDLVPGAGIDAELTFYPGPVSLRAIVAARRSGSSGTEAGPGSAFEEQPSIADFNEAFDFTTSLLAADPWLELSPWLVRDCIPCVEHAPTPGGNNETWTLRDARGAAVPLAAGFRGAWQLMAASGGGPVLVFGEWNGRTLLPLSVVAEGRFITLGGGQA